MRNGGSVCVKFGMTTAVIWREGDQRATLVVPTRPLAVLWYFRYSGRFLLPPIM